MKKSLTLLISLCVLFSAKAATERDENIKKAVAALKEGIELLEDGKIDDGAEEVRWGLELIDKAKQTDVDKFLIDEVGEFTGGEITKNKAMGMSVTERIYKDKSGNRIKVTFTRKTADAQNSFMAGINNLAKLGIMQGERVRYGGVTGSMMAQRGDVTVMLTLDDDSLFNIQSNDVDKEGVDGFAREYPIRELNEAVASN